jgi:diguanylate cyclase (GGDEF)-like protein/excisionase family DNA binding protein
MPTWFSEDLRQRAADAVHEHRASLATDLDVLVATAVPAWPPDIRGRLLRCILDLFAAALPSASLAGSPIVAELGRSRDRFALADLFTAVRLAERCVADALSLDAQTGAASDAWPAVAEHLRKASFDILASYCEHASRTAPFATAIDPATALVSAEVFELALDKELRRAIRYQHPLAAIVFEADRLHVINGTHGYGVGDLVLERIGVFTRQYFRQLDWTARFANGQFGVVLPQTSGRDAELLADGLRQAIQERLVFTDNDDQRVSVTISAVVLEVTLCRDASATSVPLDARRLVGKAEAAMKRARSSGGNVVERVEVSRPSLSLTDAAAYLQCTPQTIRRLIAEGTLPAVATGRRVRLDRFSVEAYGRRLARKGPADR